MLLRSTKAKISRTNRGLAWSLYRINWSRWTLVRPITVSVNPYLQYTPFGLTVDGAKPFSMIKKVFSKMFKWLDGREDSPLLTTDILGSLEACSLSGGPSSKVACIFDAIWLDLQTGSFCSEYCRGNHTQQPNKFCRVSMSAYAGTFSGYIIPFVNDNLFLCWNSPTLCPSPMTLPKPLISYFVFALTKEAREI